MTQYVIRRILLAIPTLLLMLTVIFVLVRLVPGDAAITILGDQASEESLKAFAAQRKAVDADASAAPVPPISNYPPLEPPSATNVR